MGIHVVICFKFSNFAYANTVCHVWEEDIKTLLFALNLVTLLMQIQSRSIEVRENISCYLL